MVAIFGHPAAAHSDAPLYRQSGNCDRNQDVDVVAVMNNLASKNNEKLNWKTSIVDLMKLLDLDSSLQSRKELAKELGYTGSTEDSGAR
jgi:hypothetical protein